MTKVQDGFHNGKVSNMSIKKFSILVSLNIFINKTIMHSNLYILKMFYPKNSKENFLVISGMETIPN